MPALPSVPDVARIVLRATLGEDVDVINRFFMAFTGTDTVGVAEQVLNAIPDLWHTHLGPQAPGDFHLQEVSWEDLTSSTAPAAAIPTSRTGSGSGAFEPAGSCIVTSFLVSRRYRGGHPRLYRSGLLSSGLLDEQTFTPTYLANEEIGWQDFFAGLLAGSPYATGGSSITLTEHVNVSYYEGFTNVLYPSGRYHAVPNRRVTPVVDPVIGYRANANLASQRRRNQQSR